MPGRKTERKRLTDRTLQSLKKANETYDVVVPNLLVRVSPKGRKTFVLYTRYPGSKNPARRSLGKYCAVPLDQARQKARRCRLKLINHPTGAADEIPALKMAQERRRCEQLSQSLRGLRGREADRGAQRRRSAARDRAEFPFGLEWSPDHRHSNR